LAHAINIDENFTSRRFILSGSGFSVTLQRTVKVDEAQLFEGERNARRKLWQWVKRRESRAM
jgi:hypothetical protein